MTTGAWQQPGSQGGAHTCIHIGGQGGGGGGGSSGGGGIAGPGSYRGRGTQCSGPGGRTHGGGHIGSAEGKKQMKKIVYLLRYFVYKIAP